MRLLFTSTLLCFCSLLIAQYEADYINALAPYLNAKTEVSLTNGRADLVNDTYAIEVERAPKWKNSIGQALWYGLQLNKRPGIILLIETAADRKYAIQLASALRYAGLSDAIRVWVYPDDFPDVTVGAQRRTISAEATGYWLNLNGNKRHTSKCRWYNNTSRGRFCTVDEGMPAGCCD